MDSLLRKIMSFVVSLFKQLLVRNGQFQVMSVADVAG
jgi:hypothetical protein